MWTILKVNSSTKNVFIYKLQQIVYVHCSINIKLHSNYVFIQMSEIKIRNFVNEYEGPFLEYS